MSLFPKCITGTLSTLLTGREETRPDCPPRGVEMSSYFTNPVDADIVSVWGAGGPIFHLAGHGEKKFKVFSFAVEFASIFL